MIRVSFEGERDIHPRAQGLTILPPSCMKCAAPGSVRAEGSRKDPRVIDSRDGKIKTINLSKRFLSFAVVSRQAWLYTKVSHGFWPLSRSRFE